MLNESGSYCQIPMPIEGAADDDADADACHSIKQLLTDDHDADAGPHQVPPAFLSDHDQRASRSLATSSATSSKMSALSSLLSSAISSNGWQGEKIPGNGRGLLALVRQNGQN